MVSFDIIDTVAHLTNHECVKMINYTLEPKFFKVQVDFHFYPSRNLPRQEEKNWSLDYRSKLDQFCFHYTLNLTPM